LETDLAERKPVFETRSTKQGYQDQIIPSSGTISNTAVSGGYQSVGMAANQDAVTLYEMSEQDRRDLAQRLKNAGYNVPLTGKYSSKLLEAYSSASMETALQNQNIPGKNFTVGQYLDQEAAVRIAGGDDFGIRKEVRVADELTAKSLINAVLKDALGRGATKEELKKYTSALQKAQKEAPVITTTTKSGDVTSYSTTGGIDEAQFLIQEIAGTDEAKANKVFSYYDAFKNALGVA
jgi:hypothetical protein